MEIKMDQLHSSTVLDSTHSKEIRNNFIIFQYSEKMYAKTMKNYRVRTEKKEENPDCNG